MKSIPFQNFRASFFSMLVILAVLADFCGSLTAAPAGSTPLTRPSLEVLYQQRQITADQYRKLGADIDAVAQAQQSLAAFMASLTPAQLKLPANQQKSNGLREHVNTARQNLSTDQARLVLKRTSNAHGDSGGDEEGTKEAPRH